MWIFLPQAGVMPPHSPADGYAPTKHRIPVSDMLSCCEPSNFHRSNLSRRVLELAMLGNVILLIEGKKATDQTKGTIEQFTQPKCRGMTDILRFLKFLILCCILSHTLSVPFKHTHLNCMNNPEILDITLHPSPPAFLSHWILASPSTSSCIRTIVQRTQSRPAHQPATSSTLFRPCSNLLGGCTWAECGGASSYWGLTTLLCCEGQVVPELSDFPYICSANNYTRTLRVGALNLLCTVVLQMHA